MVIILEIWADLNDGVHVALVVGRKVHALGAAEKGGRVLAGISHGGRVNDGRHLLNVFREKAVKQRLIPVLEGAREGCEDRVDRRRPIVDGRSMRCGHVQSGLSWRCVSCYLQ